MQRSVLVTGANSGIGRATSIALARAGFRVHGSVRSDEKADGLRMDARSAGVEVEPVVFDLTDGEAAEHAVAGLDLWGLVNNAGVMNAGAIEDVDAHAVREQFEILVVAPMRLAKAVIPGMRARGEGRIVNIGSVLSRANVTLIGWYQACKHALASANDALRAEVEEYGVEVVIVEPGGFDTPIWDKGIADLRERGARSLYTSSYERVTDLVERLRPAMGDPAAVGEVVVDVLSAGRPHPRYLVGLDAPVLETLYAVVPRRVADGVLQRVMGV